MVQDLGLPAGTIGPERVVVGDESGNAFYSGSHYGGDFLNLQNGETIPGESPESFPENFDFFFWE
jgi:hypothetical protein